MCGRFTLTHQIEAVIEALNVENDVELPPSYNIAPSQDVAVVRLVDGKRHIELMRWGLVPFWMKEKPTSTSLINARAESVHQKPAFRNAYRKRRCLIPADGFYEWRKTRSGKQPYYIQLPGHGVFCFAGLWEHWEQCGQQLHSCTILTTDANQDLQPIHKRMPLILMPDQYDQWLEAENPAQLLAPSPGGLLQIYPVSTYVNKPEHNDEACIARLNPSERRNES